MRAASLVTFVLLSAAIVCSSACASRAKCAPTQGDPALAAGAPAAGAPAQDAPGCEEAVRTAAQNVPELAARDALAEAVATCIKDEWPAEVRRCVAAARAQPDLAACTTRHERH